MSEQAFGTTEALDQALCSAVANRLAQGALAQAIEDIDPLVLDHVHDVLGDFGLELGID